MSGLSGVWFFRESSSCIVASRSCISGLTLALIGGEAILITALNDERVRRRERPLTRDVGDQNDSYRQVALRGVDSVPSEPLQR
jgi:hypothetical protein